MVRRPLVLAVAILAVLGPVAACGDDDDAVVSDPGTRISEPAPDDLPATLPGDDGNAAGGGDDGDAGDGGPRVVNPTPGLDGVVPTALDSAVALPSDKVEVRFYGGVEGCHGVDHIEVEEAAESVTVTVFTGTPPEAAARACIEIAEFQAVIVALASPLAGRAIVDGSTGAEVPLS